MSRRLQQGNCTICKILKFLPCQKKQVYNIHQKFYIRLIGCSVYLPSLDPDFVPARELLGPGPWERCWFPFGGSWWTPWCTDSLRFSWFPWHSGEAFWRPASPFPTKKKQNCSFTYVPPTLYYCTVRIFKWGEHGCQYYIILNFSMTINLI